MDFLNLDTFVKFLEIHPLLAYLILFLGSYFETLIGFSFFVYGEIFFIAGGILAGMGTLSLGMVCLFLFLGGVLGDTSSYLLGKKYGKKWLQKIGKGTFLKKYQKGKVFFQKHGAKSIFFARFMGPVAWIAPFLAGIYRVHFRQFLLYDLLGVSLGIGQFIIVGFLFGRNYERIMPLFSEYVWFVILIIFLFIFLYRKMQK